MWFNNRFSKIHIKKKKKKNILTLATLLKTTLGVTSQIMPIIMLITNILNLSLICSIWAQKAPKKKNTKLSVSSEFVNVQLI